MFKVLIKGQIRPDQKQSIGHTQFAVKCYALVNPFKPSDVKWLHFKVFSLLV